MTSSSLSPPAQLSARLMDADARAQEDIRVADARVRSAVRQLLSVTQSHALRESHRLTGSGRRFMRDVVATELLVVMALAFGVGMLVGRRHG